MGNGSHSRSKVGIFDLFPRRCRQAAKKALSPSLALVHASRTFMPTTVNIIMYPARDSQCYGWEHHLKGIIKDMINPSIRNLLVTTLAFVSVAYLP